MKKIQSWVRENLPIVLIIGLSLFLLVVNIRMTLFSYNNFDFGKFDLGNMTQMVWNTLNGRFMYLTDYFGADVPRWAMSHVDPIILLVIPFFIIYQSPLTLIFFQLVLVIFSSLLVYAISYEVNKSKWVSFCFSLVYLFYPAVGYLTAKTAYHGVTLAIPFFFLAFLLFEKMYNRNKFEGKTLILFWISVVITMLGKEQLPLYIMLFGIFVLFFRNGGFFSNFVGSDKSWLKNFVSIPSVKIGLILTVIGFFWFIMAFFVIIPAYAKYRSDGYNRFAEKLGINQDTARNVALENYFLSRYSEFGDSYSEVIKGVITNPDVVVKVAFSKMENFRETFEPLGYIPFLYPQIFMMAVPDLMVNYLTGNEAGGISEIYNHRISMIVPVLIISVIYFYGSLLRLLSRYKINKLYTVIKYLVPALFVVSTYYTSVQYENPVYMWINQAISRRLPVFIADAKTDTTGAAEKNLKLGDKQKISSLENKDRECAEKIINLIPDGATVSGPDYLGSHLSMRKTYAIFPALYDEADYVIVDVFARKIFTILGINHSMLKEIVYDILKNPEYNFQLGCGNLFVYKKETDFDKAQLLPIQERLEYIEKYDFQIQDGISVIDYELPQQIKAGELVQAKFVYTKKANNSLDGYILFITMVNRKNGDIYQMANLPSFGLLEPDDWEKGKYYIEYIDFIVPHFVDKGDFLFFIGATNTIKSQSIYLGDVEVK